MKKKEKPEHQEEEHLNSPETTEEQEQTSVNEPATDELAEMKEKYLRLYSDFENFKKNGKRKNRTHSNGFSWRDC